MNDRLNLDVDAPDKASTVLRAAAEAYRQAAGELQASWQDKNAGRVWNRLARILEAAATRCDSAIN